MRDADDTRAEMRIVLVDDNATIRRLLRELLEVDASCVVVAEADDGDGAAQAVADTAPRLKRVGLRNILFGKKKLSGAKLDKLCALSTAHVHMQAELGLRSAGAAAVVADEPPIAAPAVPSAPPDSQPSAATDPEPAEPPDLPARTAVAKARRVVVSASAKSPMRSAMRPSVSSASAARRSRPSRRGSREASGPACRLRRCPRSHPGGPRRAGRPRRSRRSPVRRRSRARWAPRRGPARRHGMPAVACAQPHRRTLSDFSGSPAGDRGTVRT